MNGMKLTTLLVGSLLSVSASAMLCESELVTQNGRLLQVFVGEGFDKVESCKEARLKCRKAQRRRQGQNPNSKCNLIGVVDGQGPGPGNTDPLPPGPGTYQYELDNIAHVLGTGGWRAREAAAQDLANIPTARALKLALKALSDSDSDVKRAAQSSVNQIKQTLPYSRRSLQIMDKMLPLLKSGGWRQRMETAKVLGMLHTAEAIIPLLDSLNDSDSDVRNAVASSLQSLKQLPDLKKVVKKNKATFESMLAHKGWKQKVETAKVIDKSGVQRFLPAIVKATGDSDSDVRSAATQAMQNMMSRQKITRLGHGPISELAAIYKSSGWKIRMNAIKVLGATLNPEARHTVLDALDDSDTDVRAAARVAIQRM